MTSTNGNFIIIIIIAAIALIAIVAVILAIILIASKRKKGNGVNNEFIDILVHYYGGITNIHKVEVENSRLKVYVNDLDAVDLEGLKKEADGGVFVTGDIVKSSFKLKSEQIKQSLESRLK